MSESILLEIWDDSAILREDKTGSTKLNEDLLVRLLVLGGCGSKDVIGRKQNNRSEALNWK